MKLGKNDKFSPNENLQTESLQYKAQAFSGFLKQFQYFCGLVFCLNFLRLGCENFAYLRVHRCCFAIVMSGALMLIRQNVTNTPPEHNYNWYIGLSYYLSQVYFLEQLVESDDLSLCFGLISMALCGIHLLGFSTMSFDSRVKITVPTFFYVIIRLFLRVSE